MSKNIKQTLSDFIGPPLSEFPHVAATLAIVEFWIILILIFMELAV